MQHRYASSAKRLAWGQVIDPPGVHGEPFGAGSFQPDGEGPHAGGVAFRNVDPALIVRNKVIRESIRSGQWNAAVFLLRLNCAPLQAGGIGRSNVTVHGSFPLLAGLRYNQFK